MLDIEHINKSELTESIENLEPGTRILAKIEIPHTAQIYKKELIYTGNIYKDGFITECGAWCMFPILQTKEQCYSAKFKIKKGKILKNINFKIGFELKSFKLC